MLILTLKLYIMLEEFKSYQINNATSIYGGATDDSDIIIVDVDII